MSAPYCDKCKHWHPRPDACVDLDIRARHWKERAEKAEAESEVLRRSVHEEHAGAAEAYQKLIQAKATIQAIYDVLQSNPPDGGAQKDIVGDGVIYRLDGQLMYKAINMCRTALQSSTCINSQPVV